MADQMDKDVAAHLRNKFPRKAEAIARCVEALGKQDIEFLSELKMFTYDEICKMGASQLFAKTFEVDGYLKSTVFQAKETIKQFWESLASAKVTDEVVELDSRMVTSSVRLAPPLESSSSNLPLPLKSSSSTLRTFKRRKLVKVRVIRKMLTLGNGTTFLNASFGSLYVRQVYEKFISIAFEILNSGKFLVRHLIVTGSPGNGKTTWGYYLLYKLSQEKLFSGRAIIWEDVSMVGSGISYYFKGTEVRQGKPGDFDMLGDKDAIFLVNGPVLRTIQKEGHIIMLCSAPEEVKASRQVIKDTLMDTRYMPMWDLCELFLAGSDQDNIKIYHRRFGGSARSVLLKHSDPEWNKEFDYVLLKVKNNAQDGLALQVRSHVFHLKVTDAECRDTAVVFASRYIEEQFMELHKMQDLKAMEYLRLNNIFIDEEAVMVGKRFEFLFLNLMSRSKLAGFGFNARNINSKQVVKLTFEVKGNVCIFHELDDIPHYSFGYYVPDYASYPCYDSIFLLKDEASAFQVTINRKHPALLDYVQDLVDNKLLTKFFYVVPQEMFADFPPQKCKQGGLVADWPDEVEVWVLEIPSDFYEK